MQIDFPYRPIPVHVPFHTSSAYERLMFGAFGSGKTYAICAEAIAFGLEQAGSRILITRRTVPELRDTTETVFFDILPQELFLAGTASRAGGHYEKFILPNGSTFLFRSIDDWNKHKSLNLAAIAYDELDEFDEETYQGMLSRVRQKDPTKEGRDYGAGEITRRAIWGATNPKGHDWCYKRFVDPSSAEPQCQYFRSTSFDNPYLPPEYLDSLLRYPEPWIRRFVLCQFDDFAGQIYEDWGWDTHTVPLPKEFDRGSTFWMGMDPGTRNPTAGLWVYVDKEKRQLVGIDEYEDARLAAQLHAAEWRKIEAKRKMKPSWRVADPSIMTPDRGTNMTLHSQYARLGYNFQLGAKDHAVRIPALGQLITARRFVLARETCPRAYEAIKDYQWEDITPAQRAKGAEPRETPLKKNDHLVDCAQYIAGRYVAPSKTPFQRAPKTWSQEVQQQIKKQLLAGRYKQQSHDLTGVVV